MTHLSQLIANFLRNSFFEEYFCVGGGGAGRLGVVGVVRERRGDAESRGVERGLSVVISVNPVSRRQYSVVPCDEITDMFMRTCT